MATTAQLIQHLTKFPEGLTFTAIQRFVAETNGLNFDLRQVVNQWEVNQGDEPRYRRQYRGYWCDRLCTGTRYVTKYNSYGHAHSVAYSRPGFLEQYCNKVGKQYVLKEGV